MWEPSKEEAQGVLELLERFARVGHLPLRLEPELFLLVLGYCQLALKHPLAAQGHSAERVREFIRQARDHAEALTPGMGALIDQSSQRPEDEMPIFCLLSEN